MAVKVTIDVRPKLFGENAKWATRMVAKGADVYPFGTVLTENITGSLIPFVSTAADGNVPLYIVGTEEGLSSIVAQEVQVITGGDIITNDLVFQTTDTIDIIFKGMSIYAWLGNRFNLITTIGFDNRGDN